MIRSLRRIHDRRLRRIPELGCLFGLLLFAIAPGCSTRHESRVASAETGPTAAERQGIYLRATAEYSAVTLFKPRVPDNASEIQRLAPLFLVPADASSQLRHSLRALRCYTNTVPIQGEVRSQLTWFWPRRNGSKAGHLSEFQGVRMTFDATGKPVLWEILSDRSGAELIFVSQNLEIAAVEEFGSALPQRLCSSERSVAEAPRLIVPNVVDDGPVPMGPIVYLTPEGDVAAIACRCSASQARELRSEHVYDWVEIPAETASKMLGNVDRGNDDAGWWDPGRLERRLRLPRGF